MKKLIRLGWVDGSMRRDASCPGAIGTVTPIVQHLAIGLVVEKRLHPFAMLMPTPDGEESMSNSEMEKELKEAGWQPTAVHPNSPTWLAPDGKIYPRPGYAWMLMTEQKLKDNKAMSEPRIQTAHVYERNNAWHKHRKRGQRFSGGAQLSDLRQQMPPHHRTNIRT